MTPDLLSVTLQSIYRYAQTVFIPQKAKAVFNMTFVVFYVASFIALTVKLQVVNLEGIVVLEVTNYKDCIRDSFFNVLMKNDYLNSVFIHNTCQQYISTKNLSKILLKRIKNLESVIGSYCSHLHRTTNLSQSSTTYCELPTAFDNVV